MKRLIFFARDLELGGVERALVNLLNALAGRYMLTLVLEERKGALLPELDRRVRVLRAPRSRCPLRPLRRTANAVLLILWAARHARRYDFSCSYCTYLLSGSRLARLASANTCLYVHNDYSRIYPDAREHAAFFQSLRADRFQRLLFVSRESREAFAARCPSLAEKTQVVGNLIGGARLLRLASEPCPFRRGEGETVFLYLGRLEERQKRLSRLLEAFCLAQARRGDLRLLLVGEGPDNALCSERIRDYGLEDRVLLCGAQSNPYPWLREADCLVLASDYEGFPVVCYEALTLGRDVISTVAVSDELLDLRACATLCEKSAASLAAAMADYRPRRRPPLDVEALDRARLRELETLF